METRLSVRLINSARLAGWPASSMDTVVSTLTPDPSSACLSLYHARPFMEVLRSNSNLYAPVATALPTKLSPQPCIFCVLHNALAGTSWGLPQLTHSQHPGRKVEARVTDEKTRRQNSKATGPKIVWPLNGRAGFEPSERQGRVHTGMEANMHIKVSGHHQQAFVTQKAWRDEQRVLAPHPRAPPLRRRIGVYSSPGLRLWSPSEVTCLKRQKILSQSLGTWTLEKSEELTTSVADLLLKLLWFLWHHWKPLKGKTTMLVTWGKPQGTGLIYFCINKSCIEKGRRICLGHRVPCCSLELLRGIFQERMEL